MLECPNCGKTRITSTRGYPDHTGGEAKCLSCGFSDETTAFTLVTETKAELYEAIGVKTHPLLNPDSKHYSMVDDIEAIERMEQMYTTKELMVWAKITAMKYRLRIGNKDDVVKEAKKIATYEAYYSYLKEKDARD